MKSQTLRNSELPPGIALCAAFGAAIVVTFVAVALGATHRPDWALLPLGLLTVMVAARTTWGAGIATAWICWALDSGFIVGREAQLTFSTPSLEAAAVLVALAVLSGFASRFLRARIERPSMRAFERAVR